MTNAHVTPRAARPSTLDLIKVAAMVTFRPMTDNDFLAFAGAPAGTVIADNHPDILVLHAPAYRDDFGHREDERLEFHGVDADGDPWSIVLEATTAI
jgi:hypothetical protein